MAAVMEERQRTEPTLRSIPAVRMTPVIPTARIPISETWRARLARFSARRKVRVPVTGWGLLARMAPRKTARRTVRLTCLSRKRRTARRGEVFFMGVYVSMPPGAAAAMTFSGVASSLSKRAVSLPSQRTRILSATARSSGSSELTTTIPRPLPASSSILL